MLCAYRVSMVSVRFIGSQNQPRFNIYVNANFISCFFLNTYLQKSEELNRSGGGGHAFALEKSLCLIKRCVVWQKRRTYCKLVHIHLPRKSCGKFIVYFVSKISKFTTRFTASSTIKNDDYRGKRYIYRLVVGTLCAS